MKEKKVKDQLKEEFKGLIRYPGLRHRWWRIFVNVRSSL